MKLPSLLLLTVGVVAAGSNPEGPNPVTKVLQLLTNLEQKISRDAEAENKAYATYAEWCKNSAQDKGFEIKTAKAAIEDLTATISKAAADIADSASKANDLGAAIGQNDADLKAATAIRKKEKDEFVAAEAELVDVVDTLDRAIHVLERKLKGSALVQSKVDVKDVAKLVSVLSAVVDAAGLSLHDKKRLMALAQNAGNSGGAAADGDDSEDFGAPAADAYKSHGEGIVDVLEDLREKAHTQLGEIRSEETNSRHNYEMLQQSLQDQIAADTKEMSEAKNKAADATEAKAEAEGSLHRTTEDLADAGKALEEVNGGCTTAAADHEASVKSRTEELAALAEAKQAIGGNAKGAEGVVYGGGGKGAAADDTEGEGEGGAAASLLQVDADNDEQASQAHGSSHLRTNADLANFEVVNLVRNLAKKEHSAALSQLASRIDAAIKYSAAGGEDPFSKVKALIKDMIVRLTSEAGNEASHKAYCDKELGDSQAKSEDLSTTIDGLKAKMDKKKALSVGLKGEVQQLSQEIAETSRSQAAADVARREERGAFTQTKTDLEQGLQGVRTALKVLREYYGRNAALVQQPVPDAPKSHVKAAGDSSGVIGMLEVIESDFGRSLAQEEMDEESAETEYQKVTQTNKISKALKEQDVKYKGKQAAALDKAVSELVSDSESAQDELDAVLKYKQGIRAACVAQPSTYEERKQRREAEVAGLKEALEILSQDAFLQRLPSTPGLRGLRRHEQ